MRARMKREKQRQRQLERMPLKTAAEIQAEAEKKRPLREHYALGRRLGREAKELELERYVTAFYGCRTSWSRVEAYGKYFRYISNKGNGGRKTERPEHGLTWAFNPGTGTARAAA